MPRRKQQAPKRAAAYDSESPEEATNQIEETGNDCPVTKKKPQENIDREDESQTPMDDQDSSTAELSGHDVDTESHTSESSDSASDAESASVKSKKVTRNGNEDTVCGSDSLEQMKAIYKSFLNNPYWSFLSLNSSQPCGEDQHVGSSGSSNNSSPGRNSYDWHQSAIAKTLQVSQKPHIALEPSIFSTVQLYRQSTKLYGSIFTGASKFHCKSCSAAYDTLLDLTVHMNETDHYRDNNLESASKGAKSWSKPRKRSLLEMEGKEDAQKVLRCMYCGHSFESLQDLSVHMIKTKHYQKVPLREPRTAIVAKVVSSFRKKAPMEVEIAKSVQDKEKKRSPNRGQDAVEMQREQNNKDLVNQKSNGVLMKSDCLKCLQCGMTYDSMEQLSAHMMLTGHFVKVTQSMKKTDKTLPKRSLPLPKKPEAALSGSCSSPLSETGVPESLSSTAVETQTDKTRMISQKDTSCKESQIEADMNCGTSKSEYLTEEDLKESPKMDFDILKSLEHTVTSAIDKAQRGSPSWGGYQSIHAAYQLRNYLKPSMHTSSYVSSVKQSTNGLEVQPLDRNQQLSPTTPPTLEEPSKADEEKNSLIDPQKEPIKGFNGQESTPLPTNLKRNLPSERSVSSLNTETKADEKAQNCTQKFPKRAGSDLYDDAAQSEPKQPSVSPLSALQSVMNLHLGKAAKPLRPVQDPMSMLLRMSNSMAERAALACPSGYSTKCSQSQSEGNEMCRDQPIDLSKGKTEQCLKAASLLSKAVAESAAPKTLTSKNPCESALSDISDMLRNLSDSQVLKPQMLLCRAEQSEIEGSHTSDEVEDTSMVQKRKGRQSHWKPQHLLILQARFTSCLRQTADGKYVISDLSSQERMVISHITGLSMTTISHWLANVKYQLRRTGRTKFIRNVDSGQPLFFCSECATQFQSRSTYVCHLESHLGFKMKDLAKMTAKDLSRKVLKYSNSNSLKSLTANVSRGHQDQLVQVPAM